MALYGAFSTSMLGMMSQSRALHNTSVNIANINTGGYKGTQTQFSTVLSRSLQNVSDSGGVRPKDISTVTKQGNMVSSEASTDVAISGKGFFVMNTAQDGTGEAIYGRDGSLEIKTVNDISVTGTGGTTITTKDGFLTDKNGYFVQGWAYTNGTVTTTGTPQSLRVDQFAFLNQFEATTTADLGLNLPAGDTVGNINQYDIGVYDSLGVAQTVKLNFTKTAPLSWNVTTTSSQIPVAQVDSITIGGTVGAGDAGDTYQATINGNSVTYTTTGTEATIDDVVAGLVNAVNTNPTISAVATATAGAGGALTFTAVTAGTALTSSITATNVAGVADNTASATTIVTANATSTSTSAATAITFNADGTIASPTTFTLAETFANGGTSAAVVDFSKVTQFYGDFLPMGYSKSGFASANMKSFNFDEVGNVVGVFEDNTFRNIYQLSLGVFTNPNALEAVNGNVYKPTNDSGAATITTAGAEGYASFSPNTRELSNVDIAEEFANMMTTQTAYNASSTVFRTADEMTIVARDLKR